MTQDAQDAKFTSMTTEPVERLICKLAVPSIVIMLITSLYNMADTYFVSSIGTSATAAVGVIYSFMAIIQAVGFFFGHGSGNTIARQLGAKQMEGAAKTASIGFFSAWAVGALLAVLGLLMLDPLVELLGATPTSKAYACAYLRYILLGMPWMTSSLTLNNLLRYQGSSFYGMIGMTSGALLNIALDPLLIFGFDMGVAGAGIATAFSQFVSCCILFVCCTRQGNLPVRLSTFSFNGGVYYNIFKGGLPSLLRQGIGSVAVIVLNRLAGNYGDAAIAAISIVSRVTMVAGAALLGFGQGFQPVCGFNYGAGLYHRVRQAYRFCSRLSLGILLALSIAGFLFAPGIISLFLPDDREVIVIGARALRFQCFSFPFLGYIVLGNMFLQTIGQALKASVLALARQGLFLIPLLLLLTPPLGIVGLQLCQPLADTATFLLALPMVRSTFRAMESPKPTIDPQDTGPE